MVETWLTSVHDMFMVGMWLTFIRDMFIVET